MESSISTAPLLKSRRVRIGSIGFPCLTHGPRRRDVGEGRPLLPGVGHRFFFSIFFLESRQNALLVSCRLAIFLTNLSVEREFASN
jgi:hypothetical protein